MMYACPEMREKGRLNEVNEFAGSFSVNPHKNGLVGFDCTGTWCVGRTLFSASLRVADLLRRIQGEGSDVPHERALPHTRGKTMSLSRLRPITTLTMISAPLPSSTSRPSTGTRAPSSTTATGISPSAGVSGKPKLSIGLSSCWSIRC